MLPQRERERETHTNGKRTNDFGRESVYLLKIVHQGLLLCGVECGALKDMRELRKGRIETGTCSSPVLGEAKFG
jgi:hypothetical protein